MSAFLFLNYTMQYGSVQFRVRFEGSLCFNPSDKGQSIEIETYVLTMESRAISQ